MASSSNPNTETVLVVGSTGNVGISAIQGALNTGRNVLAVVRSQDSAKKIFANVPSGHDRITIVEADVLSDKGVQGVVDEVRAGRLPAFQHVYASVGGIYTIQGLLEITTDELHQSMTANFEGNFFAYRAAVPYLLEQKDQKTSFTICTGAQGDIGNHPLPAMTQGALFSLCHAGRFALADTNVRFNEVYLAQRVEVDAVAEKNGTVKSSYFGKVYEQILERQDVKSSRVRVESPDDIATLRVTQK